MCDDQSVYSRNFFIRFFRRLSVICFMTARE